MIDEVVRNPEQIVPERYGRSVYQSKKRFDDGKVYLVRIIVEPGDSLRIITSIARRGSRNIGHDHEGDLRLQC